MSQKDIAHLVAAADRDQALRQKLQAAVTPDNLVKIAAEHGYEFTAEDLIALIQAQIEAQKAKTSAFDSLTEDISDDEAEIVAGGGFRSQRAAFSSYYHRTGIFLQIAGSTDICGAGSQQYGRQYYIDAYNSSGESGLLQALQTTGSYESLQDELAGEISNNTQWLSEQLQQGLAEAEGEWQKKIDGLLKVNFYF
ncbi:MAG: Nif11-like leader peptide family natural product precursor [Oscillatoria princeps RMCB-10]|nr:Nif11-like leader peptide family natural product precursor [Oscillatoria princeps RMCB-10]